MGLVWLLHLKILIVEQGWYKFLNMIAAAILGIRLVEILKEMTLAMYMVPLSTLPRTEIVLL